MDVTLKDYNVFGQAYFILVQSNGSWIYDALHKELQDEQFCKRIVEHFWSNYAESNLSNINHLIYDLELPPSHFHKPDEPKLSTDLRNRVGQFLFEYLRDTMFGDGLEGDYIRDGMSFQGLNNMTDQELLEQLEQVVDEDDDLLAEARAQLIIEAVLS